jgi:hypothetical protein
VRISTQKSFRDPPYPRTMLYLGGKRGVFSKVVLGFLNLGMTSVGMEERFKGDSADKFGEKFPLMSMGG